MFLQIKQYVVGTLFVCIRSYALIMSITFVELSVGLGIIGVDYFILVALAIAIFDILPVLGTGRHYDSLGGDYSDSGRLSHGAEADCAVSDHHGGTEYHRAKDCGRTRSDCILW